MAWSNPPTKVGERGGAKYSRYVYVPDLSKGYLVYSGPRCSQESFFVKEYPGTTDTWVVPGNFGVIDWFDISVSTAVNEVIIVYGRIGKIYRVDVNFSTHVVSYGPTELFDGDSPALSREEPPRIDYIKNDNLQYRDEASPSETEHEVGDPPDRLFLRVSADMEYNSQKFRFAAQMSPAQDVALPFSNVANTTIRYDGQTTLSSPRRLQDLSGNNYHLAIGDLPIVANYGLRSDGLYVPQVTWTVPAVEILIEAWVYVHCLEHFAYVLGGSDIRFGFYNNGLLEFSFTGLSTHTFRQRDIRDLYVQTSQLVHVAVSHTWGLPANTFMTINGSVLPADWVEDDGAEDPALGSITSDVFLCEHDYLHSMRILADARNSTQVRNYVDGKLL